MKEVKCFLLLLCTTFLSQPAYAQQHEKITELQLKVTAFERKHSNVTKRVCRMGCSVRKYIVRTQIDSGNVVSKHKTKYFKSGAKKEKIQYFLSAKEGKILLLYVVKIDGLSTYIKYCETDKNFKGDPVIVQEELLVDNAYYQKRSFDKYGHLASTENIYFAPGKD